MEKKIKIEVITWRGVKSDQEVHRAVGFIMEEDLKRIVLVQTTNGQGLVKDVISIPLEYIIERRVVTL